MNISFSSKELNVQTEVENSKEDIDDQETYNSFLWLYKKFPIC